MTDLDRLSQLIRDGSDDKAATRALSILLGAEYERENINKQSGEYREVQTKAPWCGPVWLDRADVAFRVLDEMGIAFKLDKWGERYRMDTNCRAFYHHSLSRAVWLAVVSVIAHQQAVAA